MEELKYFFSYVRTDSEFVLRLAKELRAVGANLWLDQLDILGGQHWDRTVEKALKNCKGMIAVLSPESVASENVMDEVSYALDEGKLLVPVLICSCEIPLRLRRLQYIDFTADYDTGFSQLLRALRIEQPVQPPESAAAQEPVIQDSKEPLEAKPTEPLVHEKQATQKVEEPLLSKASEPITDEIYHPKPTGLETEKAWSRTRMTKVLAAICIVAFVATISTVCFLIYFKTYRLTVEAVDGSVVKDPNQASYKRGEKVTLTAVPDPNYRFEEWSGDLSGSTNPTTIKINSNKSITASFTLKTYSLSITANGGSVTKEPNQISYKHDETVILTAVPDPNYVFGGWSGLSDSNNPAKLVMDGDKSVTASFDLNVVTNSIGMKLVYIPAGSFMMGSSDPAAGNEWPQHPVHISKGFWMGQTEVTQGQYKIVMNAQPWSGKGAVLENANNPAVYVNWDEAVAFCRKLSQREGKTYRLPTEAEWEYACRAGTTTRFSFGDSDSSLGEYAWFIDNAKNVSEGYAQTVGQKKSNPWGLYDMHGNVWEFCSDYYDKDYYSKSPSIDPKGPYFRVPSEFNYDHVARGGSWPDSEGALRCSARVGFRPGFHSLWGFGFRVVCSQ